MDARRTDALNALLLFGLLLDPAAASGILEVQSNIPATVTMDGELLGETPVKIESDAAGEHDVTVKAAGREDVRHYRFVVPKVASTSRTMRFDFPDRPAMTADTTDPVDLPTPPRVMKRAVVTPERTITPAPAQPPARERPAPRPVPPPVMPLPKQILPSITEEEASRASKPESIHDYYARRAAALDRRTALPPRSQWKRLTDEELARYVPSAAGALIGYVPPAPTPVPTPAPVVVQVQVPPPAPPPPPTRPYNPFRRGIYATPMLSMYYGSYSPYGYGYGYGNYGYTTSYQPLAPVAVNYEPASAFSRPAAAIFSPPPAPSRIFPVVSYARR